MKKIFEVLLFCILFWALTACGNEELSNEEETSVSSPNEQTGEVPSEAQEVNFQEETPLEGAESEPAGSNVLVIYFSATGSTKSLAEKMAEISEGDLYEIIPLVSYTEEDLDYNNNNSRANEEMNSDARPEIHSLSADMEQYDVILLGYPIWWGQCPPSVLTFLESYDLSGKKIMPFCTSGSSSITGSLSKIEQLCPNSTVTAGFRGTASSSPGEISQWLEENGFSPVPSVN